MLVGNQQEVSFRRDREVTRPFALNRNRFEQANGAIGLATENGNGVMPPIGAVYEAPIGTQMNIGAEAFTREARRQGRNALQQFKLSALLFQNTHPRIQLIHHINELPVGRKGKVTRTSASFYGHKRFFGFLKLTSGFVILVKFKFIVSQIGRDKQVARSVVTKRNAHAAGFGGYCRGPIQHAGSAETNHSTHHLLPHDKN